MAFTSYWLIAFYVGITFEGINALKLHEIKLCYRGYIPVGGSCRRVSWGRWSNWSECIRTEWGGLQTRTRSCKFGTEIRNGYCVGRGSESKLCSSRTAEYRIRKNVRDLTDSEVHDLLQAMTKFKRDFSCRGYYAIVRFHGWPFSCHWMEWMEGHKDGHCSYHNGPLFLPWHRIYIVQFELGLQRYLKNKTLGFPYWDWLEPAYYGLPDLIVKPVVFDPVLKESVTNPFFQSKIVGHKKYAGRTLYSQRAIDKKGMLNWKKFLASVLRALKAHSHAYFDDAIERNSHGQIHACACKYKYGRCIYGMPTISYSSWDPMFIFHHSQVDRLYALRKQLLDAVGSDDWTAGTIIGSYRKNGEEILDSTFDRPLCPFKNKTINPFLITRRKGTYTLRNSYYHKSVFGYKYDSLNLGGRPWRLIIKELKRKSKKKVWNIDTIPFKSNIFPEFGTINERNSNFTSSNCDTFSPAKPLYADLQDFFQ